MARGSSLRWLILLAALGLTLVAIVYPVDEDEHIHPTSRANTPAQKKPSVRVADSSPATQPELSPRWLASDEDPFAARGWVPPPPVEASVPQHVDAPPVVQAPPPVPPALPFQVLGQMEDGNDRIVYLKTGEQVALARSGDVLEGTYRVVAVSPTQIEFESIASGLRQTLPLLTQDN